jgi:hypothetical protein
VQKEGNMVKRVCTWPVAGRRAEEDRAIKQRCCHAYMHRVVLSVQLQDHHCSYNIINGINYLAI